MLKHFEPVRLLPSPSVYVCMEERIHSKFMIFSSLPLLLLSFGNVYISYIAAQRLGVDKKYVNSLYFLYSLLYS